MVCCGGSQGPPDENGVNGMALTQCPECSRDVSDRAASCPGCGYPLRPSELQAEVRAFRQRILTGGLWLCLIGLPVGLYLRLPYVWGLALAGIAIAGIKLYTLHKQ